MFSVSALDSIWLGTNSSSCCWVEVSPIFRDVAVDTCSRAVSHNACSLLGTAARMARNLSTAI